MRISDWSSDVCSSDLARDPLVIRIVELLLLAVVASPEVEAADAGEDTAYVERLLPAVEYLRRDPGAPVALEDAAAMCNLSPAYFSRRFKRVFGMRSEEHTSELQSLMRISYAVFCLKKKKKMKQKQ